MRLLSILLFSSLLLFGYQKGEVLGSDMVKELGLKNNKIYVIDFFASWCISCKREMPLLIKLNSDIDHTKVSFIGVDVDEEINDGKEFQKELNINFKVIDDPNGKIVGKFNPAGVPAIYIIKNGKIVAVEIGAKDHIDKIIQKHIKEAQ